MIDLRITWYILNLNIIQKSVKYQQTNHLDFSSVCIFFKINQNTYTGTLAFLIIISVCTMQSTYAIRFDRKLKPVLHAGGVAPFISLNEKSESNPDCKFHSSIAYFASMRSYHQHLF